MGSEGISGITEEDVHMGNQGKRALGNDRKICFGEPRCSAWGSVRITTVKWKIFKSRKFVHEALHVGERSVMLQRTVGNLSPLMNRVQT